MADVFSKEKRSWVMSRVRSKDTKPELAVRRLVHSLGFRYRLHRRNLPGCPDMVFAGRNKVIFVHGCFWHGHECSAATLPASNREYWEAKQTRNMSRDKANLRELRKAGWRCMVIWECQIRNSKSLAGRITNFLNG